MWDWIGVHVEEGNKVFRPTREALAVGAEYRQIPHEEWLFELGKYRFMLNVHGSGLQTPKTIEALLLCTIPIVLRMGFPLWDELVELGLPLVPVESFAEVTPESVARWWDALSPRLESFRDNCITNDGFWRMITGGRCV